MISLYRVYSSVVQEEDHLSWQSRRSHHNQMSYDKCRDLLLPSTVQIKANTAHIPRPSSW